MKASNFVLILALAAGVSAQAQQAQQPAAPPQDSGHSRVNSSAPAMPVDEIIRRFAAKEKEFATARGNYTYRQTVRVQELSDDGRPLGKFEMVSDIIFSPQGKRMEKVVFAPQSTLRRVGITPEDERDLREVQPFVLTSDDVAKYNIRYLGRQKVDEIDTYVFFVGPKVMEKGQRYFEGQIWVDDRDLQIVKTYGKAVPDVRGKNGENLFPRFETYREQIDGKYWFPTYTKAEDTLNFSTGPQRIRMVVKYEDYKYFGSESTIKFEGVEKTENMTPPVTAPSTPPNAPVTPPVDPDAPKLERKPAAKAPPAAKKP